MLSPRRIYRSTGNRRLAMRALHARAGINPPAPTERGSLIRALRAALSRTAPRPHGVYVVGKTRPSAPVRSPRTAARIAEARRAFPTAFPPVVTFHPFAARALASVGA